MYNTVEVYNKVQALTESGVESLTKPEEVEEALLNTPGTTLFILNSICRCEGDNCRNAVREALQHETIPDHLVTAFAGVDKEAVQKARDIFGTDIAHSSPCIALFKDGEVIRIIERRHIEGMDEDDILEELTGLFDEHCSRQGPAVQREEETKSSLFGFFKKKR